MCVSIYVSHNNFGIPQPIVTKFGMNVMPLHATSREYIIILHPTNNIHTATS
jgi:hypothetical protein